MKIQTALEENIRNTGRTGTGGLRWMLVDDDEGLLLMVSALAETLTQARIECYTTPAEALAAFNAAPDQYELVVTDYEMPGMDGVELCRRIHAVRPRQKIFLATGSRYFTGTAARFAGFSALLEKPFPLTALKEALAANFAGAVKYCSAALVLL